tara:strand:- start:63 stop:383 length:321 start_codon:yes stop_codon:yes gene_type:complete
LNLVKNYFLYRKSMEESNYLEKHPFLQERLFMIEKWCEDLEDRIDDLESNQNHYSDRVVDLEKIAHPKCGIEEFDGYDPLVQRLNKIERNLRKKSYSKLLKGEKHT